MGKAKFGPGFLVAAAFVGPGTVTTATLAGAKFGFSLIWVVVIAIISAIVLQEMVGRFSLSYCKGAGEELGKICFSDINFFSRGYWLRSL